MIGSAAPVMAPEEFRILREFVSERYGILIDEAKVPFLSVKLRPRLQELRLKNFSEYYSYLKFGPRGATEHLKLLPLLTNNETYFYREEPQLRLLSEHVLPAVRAHKDGSGSRTLTIVSAGCSTGEEAYTIGILLLESGLFFWNWKVSVIGVDVDPEAIAKAEAGKYGSRAFHSLPEHLREKYFVWNGEEWKVADSLMRVVQFRRGNILSLQDVVEEKGVDIIFCRNVFIYFPDAAIRRAVGMFRDMLSPKGYLFLGHSESLSRITSEYAPERHPTTIIYRPRR